MTDEAKGQAWRDGKVPWVVSTDILKEDYPVGKRLSRRHPGIDMGSLLLLLIWNIEHGWTGCTGCFFLILNILFIPVQKFLSPLSNGRNYRHELTIASHGRLIVDDKEARSLASASGVKHLGTVGVLLEASLKQRLDSGELEAMLRDLSQVLWLSPAVVAEALRLAREAKR